MSATWSLLLATGVINAGTIAFQVRNYRYGRATNQIIQVTAARAAGGELPGSPQPGRTARSTATTAQAGAA